MVKYKRITTILAFFLILWLLYIFDPITFPLTPKCPTKLLFKIDCPSCGIQRAIHALLLGNFSEAIRYNYYLLLAFPYAGFIMINYLFLQGQLKEKCSRIIENRYVVIFYVSTYLLWFLIRNLLSI